MRSFPPRLLVIGVVLAVTAVWAAVGSSSARTDMPFQSGLPIPNPNYITRDKDGRIFCGAQQSPVWLDIPKGYIAEGGAEIHCDPTRSLSNVSGVRDAW